MELTDDKYMEMHIASLTDDEFFLKPKDNGIDGDGNGYETYGYNFMRLYYLRLLDNMYMIEHEYRILSDADPKNELTYRGIRETVAAYPQWKGHFKSHHVTSTDGEDFARPHNFPGMK